MGVVGMPAHPSSSGRQRQQDEEFKATLDYAVSLGLAWPHETLPQTDSGMTMSSHSHVGILLWLEWSKAVELLMGQRLRGSLSDSFSVCPASVSCHSILGISLTSAWLVSLWSLCTHSTVKQHHIHLSVVDLPAVLGGQHFHVKDVEPKSHRDKSIFPWSQMLGCFRACVQNSSLAPNSVSPWCCQQANTRWVNPPKPPADGRNFL